MTDRISELADLDPTLGAPPPAPGSDRFRLIQEKAMQTITTTTDKAPRSNTPPSPSNPRRGRLLQLVAAGAAAVLAASVLMMGSDNTPAAAAVVSDAAENLEEVRTLRATLVQTYPHGVLTFEGEFAGADGRQLATQRGADAASWEIIVVGDSMWTVSNGDVRQETVPSEEQLAPFAKASAAVLAASLEGTDVRELGTEPVRGRDTVRYRILPDERSRAALAALEPGELSWFALEDPSAVTAIEVWVSDDLVRRIEIIFSDDHFMTTSAADFYDFGAGIVISPPR
ncbi:MAG TPA: hypothetical protein VGV93_09475 [Acidimicrobiales bacterium]|nr:hypothetical protein [Acidimicrobiales bacterium]